MRLKTGSVLGAYVLLFGSLLRAGDKMDFAGAHDQFTPLAMQTTVHPVAVPAADGATHLDYELQLVNTRSERVTIQSIEVLDADSGGVLLTLAGDEVKKWFALIDRTATNKLEASQAGYAWLDVVLHGATPKRLRHRVTLAGKEAGLTPGAHSSPEKEISLTEQGGETTIVAGLLLTLGPPLEGKGWVVFNGCCVSPAHRRAGLPINGSMFVAQRFAIDWMKLGEDGRLVHGKVDNNRDYTTYGQHALAVADATVASVLDGLPERVAGQLPPDTTIQNVTGNHVILNLGGGRYAFYAHLQPGSIRVKVGDKVKRGQWLALVGNSGNTSAPHLHFHVTDALSPLAAQGVPYVIGGFTLVGEVADFDNIETAYTTPMPVKPLPPPAVRKLQYPLDNMVVDFPQGK